MPLTACTTNLDIRWVMSTSVSQIVSSEPSPPPTGADFQGGSKLSALDQENSFSPGILLDI